MNQRALHINSVYGSGSTGRIVHALHGALKRSGWESWAAFGRGPESGDENVLRIGRPRDVYTHVALTRILDWHGRGSRAATQSFIRHLSALDPDVIHLHNIHGYYLNYEVLFEHLRRSRAAVIWTLHDCWAFTGHCAHFDFAGCDRWMTHCDACPQRSQYPKSWVLDSSRTSFSAKLRAFSDVPRLRIVTPSAWLADNVRRSFLNQYATVVIPNGIDLSVFRPTPSDNIRERLGIPAGDRVILGVAASFEDERKGFHYLVELAGTLPKDATIVLVGVSPRQARCLPKTVIGLPRTNSVSDLASLYSAASVFVNPTLEENFPTVALEALACGTPIASFDTGGCKEQVDEHTGVVVPRGDSDALRKAVDTILYRGKDAYMGACLARSRQYAAERMIDDYLALYEDRSAR
jgi:putative colanic acid biosynthesis glycosyltransferase